MSESESCIRALLLSKYPRQGASSRLRFLQYLPGLEKAGIEITQAPLFSDNYLSRRYDGEKSSGWALFRCYLRRCVRLFTLLRYDVLWVQAELFPMLPPWAEIILARFGAKMIIDYDDAIFHNYDLANNQVVRRLLGNKIRTVMRCASVVTTGNEYLADYARMAGARHVEVIPTVVDVDRYLVKDKGESTLLVGWIGTPITMAFLRSVAMPLERACAEAGARIRLIGADESILTAFSSELVEVVKWTEASEGELLSGIHLGIMPLNGTLWDQGKCGYKLIQYMASGAAILATHTNANAAIVERGKCGLVIAAEKDPESAWYHALKGLLENVATLKHLGQNGRNAVEEVYSLQAQLPRIIDLMRVVSKAR